MPVWLIKLALKIIPPDKLLKIGAGVLMAFLGIIILLFAAPLMTYKHLPMGKTQEEFNYYVDATEQIQGETGILINWQKIMAIDAELLQQDFSLSDQERAYSYKDYFIREEEEEVSDTCTREVEVTDEEGNVSTDTEEYDCSYTVTVYYERSFDEVLQMLVADRRLASNQVEDVKRYTTFDISALRDIYGTPVQMPGGWIPSGSLTWPVPNVYTITSPFSTRIDPITFKPAVHTGVDIGAASGTTIVAVKAGTVTHSGYMGTAGNAVIIQHDGFESRYYHMKETGVRKGQQVSAGEAIGKVGTTGRSTGPHLHLEIRIDGTAVDPMSYFK